MNCPKCKSTEKVKDGIVKERQRYQCKKCKYRYTVEQRGKPMALKKLALQMYLEGLGFRSIERILNVSNVTVMNWIKSFGKQLHEFRKEESDVEIIELDEIHTYIRSKKTTVGSGLLLIGLDENSSISCLVQGGQKRE
jgi:transposase-like protein